MPKPMRDAGMVMVLTQPVCRPKYMLEKQMTRPTRRPTRRPRGVKEAPGMILGVLAGGGVRSGVLVSALRWPSPWAADADADSGAGAGAEVAEVEAAGGGMLNE